MAGGSKLDGAGIAKMTTLEDVISHMQRIHGTVEKMALVVRAQQDTTMYRQQVGRMAKPLVGQLKGQFGMIADQVASLLLVLTRGGGDQTRLRMLREHVAQIRTALDIAVTKTKELHTHKEEEEKPKSSLAEVA